MLTTYRFDDFAVADFPLETNSSVRTHAGYLYVFFWVHDGKQIPFYVGQTRRFVGRMNDYRLAQFATPTDFRVGEAIQYMKATKECRILVRYRGSLDPRKDERHLIRELQLHGLRLLNDFSSYAYLSADEGAERCEVHRMCESLFTDQRGAMAFAHEVVASQPRESQPVESSKRTQKAVMSSAHARESAAQKKNHYRLAEALKGHDGEELSTGEIRQIILERDPDFSPGSVLPNDHADGNKSSCWCARTPRRLFDRIERNLYRVSPPAAG